ncbi:MAG: tetratricopeptide repeat protein [Endomicrobiales bacterium]
MDSLHASPDNAFSFVEKGRALFSEGKYEPALREFREAVARGYDSVDLRIDCARAHCEMGEFDAAEKEVLRAKALDPSSGKACHERAIINQKRGDYEAAVRDFKEAIEKGLDIGDIHWDLSRMYLRLGRHDLAAEELGKLIAARPLDGQLNADLGRLYLHQKKDPRRAVEEFNEAFRKGFDNKDVRLEMVWACNETGDRASAIEQLRKALEHDPGDGRLHHEMGIFYQADENFEEAEKEYRVALESGHDNSRIHRDLCWLLRRKGETDAALRHLRRAAEIEPAPADLHIDLGRIYAYEKRDLNAAVREFEEAKRRGLASAPVLIELGKLYRRSGNREASLEQFRRAGEVYPDREDPVFANRLRAEMELSEGGTTLGSKPRILTVTLTSRCQLNCRMCEVRRQWKEPWDLPEKTAREVMELFPSLEYVTWSGGETFLYAHFKELFEKAARYPGLRQEIVTNGHLIDDDWAQRLAGNKVTLIYSIDGFTPESYESIRRGGRYDELLKSLERIRAWRDRVDGSGLYLVLNFVVMKSNVRQLEHLMDFAARYGFKEVRLAEVKFVEDEENIFLHRDREALAYINGLMPRLAAQARERKLVFRRWFLNLERFGPPGPAREEASPLGGGEPPRREEHLPDRGREAAEKREEEGPRCTDDFFCFLPWREMYLEPGGSVKLQCFCNRIVGNIHENSVQDIWNGAIMKELRQRILEKRCGNFCDGKCLSGEVPRELLGFPVS